MDAATEAGAPAGKCAAEEFAAPPRSDKAGSEQRHVRASAGFTLLELLVVISLVGVLMAILLPAVQAVREAARRMQCANNLRQQVQALQNYHAAHRTFPAGRIGTSALDHSWSAGILPFLEQGHVWQRMDFSRRWNAPGQNRAVSRTVLPVFRCPSSLLAIPGDTDYGGMRGSILSETSSWLAAGGVFNSGVLIHLAKKNQRPISIAEVLDGTSQTICVAEASDRLEEEHGMWADGLNSFSHDNGPINEGNSGEIYSWHPGGAYVGVADGSVHFLSESTSLAVLGALCTRAGGEVIDPRPW